MATTNDTVAVMYRDPATIGTRDFAMRAMFGLTFGSHEPEMQLRLGKAIMIIAGADGEISDPEWTMFVSAFRAAGMPEPMLQELARFDACNARLEDYVSQDYKHLKAANRIMIYAAIWIARADGDYAAEERAMVARAAKILGVDDDILAALEGQAAIEEAAATARAQLLFPDLRTPARQT